MTASNALNVETAQPVLIANRSTHSSMKRTLSVDNIESVVSDDLLSGRARGSYVVNNSKRSRKKQQPKQQICLNRNELHLIIEVVKCRRLGQPKPDRCQPILATLRSSSEVEAVMRVAKDLRYSDDATVRNSVYINPDMTSPGRSL